MSRRVKGKRRAVKLALFCLAAAGAGAGIYMNYRGSAVSAVSEKGQAYVETKVQRGTVAVGITESGSVTYGSNEQDFSVAEITEVSQSDSSTADSSSAVSSGGQGMAQEGSAMAGAGGSGAASGSGSTSSGETSLSLTVNEVCVAVGQVVQAGDAVLKIDPESIEAYQTALEAAVATAELLVQQEEINVETKRAEADYTYQMHLAEGETAEATYNATITSLENAVTDLEEDLEESAEAIAEYEEELANGEDVEEELEEEQLNYETIEADIQIAKNNLTTQSIEAKQVYETALTNYQYAEQLYEIDTNGVEDDLDDAKENLEEAEAALEEFISEIGDGTIYAEYSGVVMSVAYAQGDTLVNDSTVVTYSDPKNVTMTVAVSQEDVASVAVGDEASIALTAYDGESFSGEVQGIASSSSIGSSTVNYDVEVLFTGDTGKVYSGMTGEVTFVEKEVSDVLYISNKAVHQEGTRSWVKVKDSDGTIREVTVGTGFSNGTLVEITDGLEEGETVLIESQVDS